MIQSTYRLLSDKALPLGASTTFTHTAWCCPQAVHLQALQRAQQGQAAEPTSTPALMMHAAMTVKVAQMRLLRAPQRRPASSRLARISSGCTSWCAIAYPLAWVAHMVAQHQPA